MVESESSAFGHLREKFVFTYCLTLFVTAIVLLAAMFFNGPQSLPAPGIVEFLFFYLFSIFTITAGYSHQQFGYISMDRVGQLSNLLLFGPFWGALINGLASFSFAWFRLFKGIPLANTLNAVMANMGMMTLMTLSGGYIYQKLGGEVPISVLSTDLLLPLLATLISMQVLNEVAIFGLTWLRGLRIQMQFTWSATGIELFSGLVGLLVALLYTRVETMVFALFIGVLMLGMLVQKKYALMQQKLETLVAERTRELEQKTLELQKQATHDPLTGLYNRRYANEFLKNEVARFARYQHPMSVAMADVDHFKRINDRFYHEVGDKVLVRLAVLFRENCRKTDLVARMGGEEFLFCFPETGLEAACEKSKQIIRLVEGDDWSRIAPGLSVTLSMGVVSLQDGTGLSELLGQADRKLYRAKDLGRNRVCC